MPYQVFAASDGHLIVAVGNDSQFRNYCGVIGLPELSADPRFSTNPQRVKNREELVPLLAERMATGARDHWLAALEGVGVPAGPINTLDHVYEDPQVLARGMKRELPHPAAGSAHGRQPAEAVRQPCRVPPRPAHAGRAHGAGAVREAGPVGR